MTLGLSYYDFSYYRTGRQLYPPPSRAAWEELHGFIRIGARMDPSMRSVTTEEVRTRQKMDDAESDADLELMIRSAEEWFEEHSGLLLFERSLQVCWDGFPQRHGGLPLWVNPFGSVTSVQYRADDSAYTPLANTKWRAVKGRIYWSFDCPRHLAPHYQRDL